jgi:hypothetical protein
MNSFSGLPTHPLLVHIPVAMLPLATFGVVIMLAKQAWYERYRWAVLFVAAIGTVGAILASGSGEGLQEDIRATRGVEAARAIHEHAEAGDLARGMAIIFFIALAAYVVGPWLLERKRGADDLIGRIGDRLPSWTPIALKVVAAVTALAATGTVINAGHSGASEVWEDPGTASAIAAD